MIEPWIPDSIRAPGGDPYRRARIAVAFALLLLGAGALVIPGRLHGGASLFTVVPPAVGMTVVAVLLWDFRRRGRLGLLGQGLCVVAFSSVMTLNWLTRGTLPGPLLASGILPVISVMVLGAKRGALWGTLAVLQLAFALSLTVPRGSLEPFREQLTRAWQIAPPLCAALLLGLTLVYESLKTRALDQMEDARTSAERADRSKSRLIANTSHELRTPLSGIIGLSELLLTTRLDADQREMTTTLNHAALRLLGILNQLLDLADAESHRDSGPDQWFELEDLVEDVKRLLEPSASGAGLSLVARVSTPREIRGNSEHLRQVLLNLVANAIKFTDTGHVAIDAVATPREHDRARISIAVQDTGIGIPSDRLHAIFEPFEQVHSRSERRPGGTGLGLAISRELVHKMGGQLLVSSTVGRGSRFEVTVELPARESEPASHLAHAPPDPPPAALCAHVILADDDEIQRLVLERNLAGMGCRVTAFDDGGALLECLDWASHDLVILDSQMPGVDGLATARLIREREAQIGLTRSIPIVTLTANPTAEDTAREAGVDAYLTKPVNAQQLRQTLVRCLEAARDAAAPVPQESPPSPCAPLLEPGNTEQSGDGLLERWRVESTQQLTDLRAALKSGDAETAASLAHRCAGANGVLGARRSAVLLTELETCIRAGRERSELLALLEASERAHREETTRTPLE